MLEATGTLIVDRRESFDAMRDWSQPAITALFKAMIAAVASEGAW